MPNKLVRASSFQVSFEKGVKEKGKGGWVCVRVFVVNLATFFRAIGFSKMKSPFERWVSFVGYFVVILKIIT
jgi:hypothetical protein